MRRALLCVAGMILAAPMCGAETTTNVPMSAWKVVDGDSIVRGDFLLLRNESAVEAKANMPVARLIMSARTTEERRQGVLTQLTLTYDDGSRELASLRVPADTRQHEVTFQPQFADWRRVVGLKLMHPADDMELHVSRLTAVTERPAMVMTEGSASRAGVVSPDVLEDGLLKVKWTNVRQRAEISAPRSRQVIVFGSRIADSTWGLEDEENLILEAVDRRGAVLARYSEPLSGRVQPVLFYLYDLDLTRVDRLVFKADGNANFAIRQIIAGGMFPGDTPPGKQKWGGLEPVNDRFEIVISILEQGGDLPQEILWQLKQLLLDYRRLE